MDAPEDAADIAHATRSTRTARACAVLAALLVPLNLYAAASSARTHATPAAADLAMAIAGLEFAVGALAVIVGVRAGKGKRPVATIVVGGLLALLAPAVWMLGGYAIAMADVFK